MLYRTSKNRREKYSVFLGSLRHTQLGICSYFWLLSFAFFVSPFCFIPCQVNLVLHRPQRAQNWFREKPIWIVLMTRFAGINKSPFIVVWESPLCMEISRNCDMKPPAPMDDDDNQVLEPTHAENALSTHAEASKMLEAALQQMDGIIAGYIPWIKLVCHEINSLKFRYATRAEEALRITRFTHCPKINPRSSGSTTGCCRDGGRRQEASLQVDHECFWNGEFFPICFKNIVKLIDERKTWMLSKH